MSSFFKTVVFEASRWSAWMTVMGLVCSNTMLAQADDLAEEDIFNLPIFEVTTTGDRGYLSTNSTSGTSLDTLIRDLPMSLEVVNRELIEDLQATDMKEALRYSAGVYFESHQNSSSANTSVTADRSPSAAVNISNPFANSISIRGYSVPNQQRLGFRIGAYVSSFGVVLGGSTDMVNVERQEVVRGPQSLLYGVNVLSGVVNIIPARPLSENTTRISASVGSQDYVRATLDQTGPLIPKKLNYRFAASHTELGDRTDFLLDKKDYYVGQLEWFITPKVKLFVESQYSEANRTGGGPFLFVDGGIQNNNEFLNEYDERITFGRDFNNSQVIDNPAFKGQTDKYGEVFGRPYLIQKPNQNYDFPDLGPDFRISGPDVHFDSREFDFLALATIQPLEGLAIELGAYYTKIDSKEFNVNLGVFNNSIDAIQPSPNGENGYRFDPESGYNPVTQTLNDQIGWGLGQLFIAENPKQYAAGQLTEDRKFGRYFWYEKPTSSESIQVRGRVAYQFKSSFLTEAHHTFSAGATVIRDEVSFVNSSSWSDGLVYSKGDGADNYVTGRNADDPYQFRDIFDYSVIRYQGEQLAIPGNVTTNRLAGLDIDSSYVARSGWIDTELTYEGYYGLYNGQFLQDKLNVIFGIRRDIYQAKEMEQLRVMDRDRETSNWIGTGQWNQANMRMTDTLIGYGDQPYTYRDEFSPTMNANIQASIDELRATLPNGTVGYNFEKDQKFDTKSFGASYRVADWLSVYYQYAEGIFPNTGLKDGVGKAIGAEQTTSNEIGLKFEVLNQKISGTISFYEIERENAVWWWSWAPAPANWAGGPGEYAKPADAIEGTFNPNLIRSGESSLRVGTYEKYVREAFEIMGIPLPSTDRNGRLLFHGFKQYGAASYGSSTVDDPTRLNGNENFFGIDYEQMMAVDAAGNPQTYRIGYEGSLAEEGEEGVEVTVSNPLKLAMDLAVRDQTSLYTPVPRYSSNSLTEGSHQASNSAGANVTFEEKGQGIDGQFIFEPIQNYQILFSFSHQEREVTGNGFNLMKGLQVDQNGDPVDDVVWTTEYDIWVYLLGPESFEDPKDPSTLKGGAISGLDLSFVPKDSYRLWNKYTFTEGPLSNLEIGGGVQYNGPVATSVPVGGAKLAVNRFLTPRVPERYIFDAFITYRAKFWNVDWSFSLKVDNLLNDDSAEAVATYFDNDGGEVKRRTRVYYQPRTFRFAVSMLF